ncbi:hypothetical protein K8R66_02890 [bacterium]|nr:hypothetical protein [bacterium]
MNFIFSDVIINVGIIIMTVFIYDLIKSLIKYLINRNSKIKNNFETQNDPKKTIIICPHCKEITQSPNKGTLEKMIIVEGEICPYCLNKIKESLERNQKFAQQNGIKKIFHKTKF